MRDDFEARLKRLIDTPEQIEGLWTKLRRPLLRWWGVQPALSTAQLQRFVEAVLDERPKTAVLSEQLLQLQRTARREFDANLEALERNYLIYGHNDPQQLGWMSRAYPLWLAALRAHDVAKATDDEAGNSRAAKRAKREVAGLQRHALAPLVATDDASPGVQQQLDAVDVALDAADAEKDFLGRRRALLQSARELLLVAAEQAVDRSGVQARLRQIADRMADLDRVQAAGVQMHVALPHQLRAAWRERDMQKLNACLATLETAALEAGDVAVANLTSDALDRLWSDVDRTHASHRLTSLRRSGEQTLQREIIDAVTNAQEQAKKNWEMARGPDGKPTFNQAVEDAVASYLSGSPETELIQAALYVDGCVDVGGVITPHRVEELHSVIREVRYPTQHLALRDARDVLDIPHAVINDPRAILFELASQRLLTRRYIGEEQRKVERRVMASEARIYLLDGSGSMLGPRARMRDAILVAELSTMIARLNQRDRWLTPTLYYRYFNQTLAPVRTVTTADEAISAIEDILSWVRHGGTDIQGALLESFALLRDAQSNDPTLARAQIVLVTDGEADVDEAAILKARSEVAELPIGVSIIALGQENPALRKISAAQRARGERVFYQFVPDDMLKRLISGKHTNLTLHLPEQLERVPLAEDLGLLVAEIEMASRARDERAMANVSDEVDALTEVGVGVAQLPETERARIMALTRDRQTLERRFLRWFPKLDEQVGEATLTPSDADQTRINTLLGLLAAVAEVTELLEGEPLRRQADAVEMLERLLLENGMTLPEYASLLERYPDRFHSSLELMRYVCLPE